MKFEYMSFLKMANEERSGLYYNYFISLISDREFNSILTE